MKTQKRDMEFFAERFGVPVERIDLPNGAGGQFVWEVPCISINRHRHPLDQQYSIAHELGHFESFKRKWYYRFRPMREFEAALGAYALLLVGRRFDVIQRHLDQNPHCLPLAAFVFLMWPIALLSLKASKWFSQ